MNRRQDKPPGAPARAAGADDGDSTLLDLRILATSDLHAHILPHDYLTGCAEAATGLACLAPLIAAERAAAGNVLLFDNGDFLNGSVLAEVAASGAAPAAPHPAIAAMNAVGYDAAALGNHEFDHGLPFLASALAAARFPVVAANAEPLDDASAIAAPWVLLRRTLRDRGGRPQALTIGVAGFLPPQVAVWNRAQVAGRLRLRGIVETALDVVPAMRRAGADVVVALCHAGIGADAAPEAADPAAENAALALARVPGIDAVVAGHSHALFPGPAAAEQPPAVDPARGLLAGRPAVMPGHAGSHLGVIDLTLAPDAARGWRATAWQSRLVAAAAPGAGAAPVAAAAAQAHAATLAQVARPVGETAVPLTTYLALAEPSAAVALVAAAQADAVRTALAEGPHAGLPVLSAAAPFRAGGRAGPRHYTDIPPGPLTVRHLFDLSPYPNTVCALRVTGRILRAWIGHASALYRPVAPGARDAALLDPALPAYGGDTIFGLDYRIDLAARPGPARAGTVLFDGSPLDDDQPFVLAVSSYRAWGGGGFPGAGPDAVIHAGRTTIREALATYLARIGRYDPAPRQGSHFRPMPGTTVLVRTGPGVAAHLGGRHAVLPPDPADDGFVQVRLVL